jgi:hypothetical protein
MCHFPIAMLVYWWLIYFFRILRRHRWAWTPQVSIPTPSSGRRAGNCTADRNFSIWTRLNWDGEMMRHNCKTRTWRVAHKYFGEDVPHTFFGFGACWQSFGMAVVKRNVDRLWNKVIVFFWRCEWNGGKITSNDWFWCE